MKINLYIILLLVCELSFSQEFEVTKKGLRDHNSAEKNYLVLNIDKKTAVDLYNISLKFMGNDYLNPGTKLLDKSSGQTLIFETSIKKFVEVKNAGGPISVNARYRTKLNFKDQRMKYSITDLVIGNGVYEVVWKGDPFQDYVIWNQKDELIRPDLKIFIEDYFSKEAKDLKTYLLNYKDEDDW